MRIPICGKVLLAAVMITGSTSLWAQDTIGPNRKLLPIDTAVTYSAERTQLAPGNCGCFWLQGGGIDAGLTLWRGFGIAASLTGDHISNYAPGLDLNKVTYVGGPRYTYTVRTHREGSMEKLQMQIFGEGLFGRVYAFDGTFPSSTGLRSTAGSLALGTGGGIGVLFSRSFGVRLLEADYIRTELPNGYSNTQNDLRLAFGLNYHFGSVPQTR